jgi:hypothetical protein
MARLVHEIWIDAEGLPGLSLAGPMGADARRLHGPGARLVHSFVAGSHTEAMTIYNEFLNRETYVPAFPEQDNAPYPDDWQEAQVKAGVWRDCTQED